MNQYQIDRNQWAAKKYVCAVCASLCQFLLTSTINQAKFNKSMLHRPPSHLSEKTVLLPCKLRKPELSLQGQRKSLPSSGSDHLLEIISMSHEHDVQVVVSWRLVCLESTLHIMLSRPIWPCIRKKGWTAGILFMLQLIRSNHGLQWWADWRRDLVPEDSDFWWMDKESWERVTSVTAPVIWAFSSFLLD